MVGGDSGAPVLVEFVKAAEVKQWAENNKPAEGPDADGVLTPRKSDDARVLPLHKNVSGEHHRDWRDLALAIVQVEADGWIIAGPRVAIWRDLLAAAGLPVHGPPPVVGNHLRSPFHRLEGRGARELPADHRDHGKL